MKKIILATLILVMSTAAVWAVIIPPGIIPGFKAPQKIGGVATSFDKLLLENGDALLLESGDNILLEG